MTLSKLYAYVVDDGHEEAVLVTDGLKPMIETDRQRLELLFRRDALAAAVALSARLRVARFVRMDD